ncbi:MAG TPA: alpha/beta hydrolase, partial [Acidimicrobiales bacterium]|nr:alpha/beta hydrolase [Acidimicrobiales bacterium]
GGYRCWAVDMRGHGASGPSPTRRYDDWDLAAADLLAVVDALPTASGGVAGVGHSFGAATLVLAEQARPGTFAALWCYEPIIRSDEVAAAPGDPSIGDVARHRRNRFDSAAAAVARFAPKPPFRTWAPGLLEAYVATATRPTPDGVELVLSGPEEATCYEGAGRHGAWPGLATLGLPVTVAAAPLETGGPATWAQAVADAIPAGRFRRFAGLTHFGPLEQPAVVAAAISDDLGAMGFPGRSTGAVTPPR